MDAAAILRDARRRAGLSQAALAVRAGTSQATISAYESGVKQPTVATFSRILSATGTRLTVEPGQQPLIDPSRTQHARAGRTLERVLELAQALPVRHAPDLGYPRLPAP